jgi:hypothetical protein
MYTWILLVVLILLMVWYFFPGTLERFGQVKALRNLPTTDCETMCEGIYDFNQRLGRGMDADQSRKLVSACKTACLYSPFQKTGW